MEQWINYEMVWTVLGVFFGDSSYFSHFAVFVASE